MYLGELGKGFTIEIFPPILAEFQPSLDISSQGKLEIKRGGRARGAREKKIPSLNSSPPPQIKAAGRTVGAVPP